VKEQNEVKVELIVRISKELLEEIIEYYREYSEFDTLEEFIKAVIYEGLDYFRSHA
jgi:hypothetical protein